MTNKFKVSPNLANLHPFPEILRMNFILLNLTANTRPLHAADLGGILSRLLQSLGLVA